MERSAVTTVCIVEEVNVIAVVEVVDVLRVEFAG